MDIVSVELEFLRDADLSNVDLIIAELHRTIYHQAGMQECHASFTKAGFVVNEENSRVGVVVYHMPNKPISKPCAKPSMKNKPSSSMSYNPNKSNI